MDRHPLPLCGNYPFQVGHLLAKVKFWNRLQYASSGCQGSSDASSAN
jgi:hypothetical protein